MVVYILLSKYRDDNYQQIEGVYENLQGAQSKMREFFEATKKTWEAEDMAKYKEVYIACFDRYADAYVVNENYQEVGMSWYIQIHEVK